MSKVSYELVRHDWNYVTESKTNGYYMYFCVEGVEKYFGIKLCDKLKLDISTEPFEGCISVKLFDKRPYVVVPYNDGSILTSLTQYTFDDILTDVNIEWEPFKQLYIKFTII